MCEMCDLIEGSSKESEKPSSTLFGGILESIFSAATSADGLTVSVLNRAESPSEEIKSTNPNDLTSAGRDFLGFLRIHIKMRHTDPLNEISSFSIPATVAGVTYTDQIIVKNILLAELRQEMKRAPGYVRKALGQFTRLLEREI